MPRVFACLAVSELFVLLGVAVLGLMGEPRHTDRHIVLAVFALLLSCLIQVIVFTYLTVTGKMMAQAVHLAHFSLEPLSEAKRYKRAATWSMAALLATIVAVTITGAQAWRIGKSGFWHLGAAIATIVAHALVYYRQHALVRHNAELLDRLLQRYAAQRPGRGKPGRGF